MALPTIYGVVELPAGQPGSQVEAFLELVAAVDGTALGHAAVASVGSNRRVRLDATGRFEFTSVRPNSGAAPDAITSPTGTCYRLRVRFPDGDVTTDYIDVPDTAGDILFSTILTVAPDAILDSAVEQAIAAASVAPTVVTFEVDGDIGVDTLTDWTDASEGSTAFDRLSILSGRIVVPDPDDGPIDGTNPAAHGAAWKDWSSLGAWTGERVSVSFWWTGERPMEATPLLHVVEDGSDEYGIGVWPIGDILPAPGDQPAFGFGHIGDTNVHFQINYATAFTSLPAGLNLLDGRRHHIDLRSWDGEWSLWVDGALVIPQLNGVDQDPWMAIPSSLLGSTKHGFAVDNNQLDGVGGAGGTRTPNVGAGEGPWMITPLTSRDQPVIGTSAVAGALAYKADTRNVVDRAGDTMTGALTVNIAGVGTLEIEPDGFGGLALKLTQNGDSDTSVGLGSILGKGSLSLGDGSGNQAYLVHAGDDVLSTIGKFQQGTAASESTDLVRLNEAVLKSLFDAHTILAATSDNTPAALTVGASTVVGRAASGGIVALTPAQLRTIIDLAAQIGATTVGGDITGTVSNAQIVAGTIVNADISGSAAIDGTKVNYATTNAQGAVEFASDSEHTAMTSTDRVTHPAGVKKIGDRQYRKVLDRSFTGCISESFSRFTPMANTNVLSSGRAHMWLQPFRAGDVLSSCLFFSGATPAGTPLNQWAFVADTSRVVLAVSGDLTTTAWAATSFQQFVFGTPYTFPTDGGYYFGLVVRATTPPTLSGITGNVVANAFAPIPMGFSTTGLTTPVAVGTTMAALTAHATCPYVACG